MDNYKVNYTPGPWLVKMKDSPVIVRADGIEIAKVAPKAGDFNRLAEGGTIPRNHLISNERNANTMLMAAAPELDRALSDLVALLREMGCDEARLQGATTALMHARGKDIEYYRQ